MKVENFYLLDQKQVDGGISALLFFRYWKVRNNFLSCLLLQNSILFVHKNVTIGYHYISQKRTVERGKLGVKIKKHRPFVLGKNLGILTNVTYVPTEKHR